MANLPLIVGEAEILNKWKSGICGSISESIGEVENLMVDEAKKVVMEKQTSVPPQLARYLAGKYINKKVLSEQMSEGTETSITTFTGEETIQDCAQFSASD